MTYLDIEKRREEFRKQENEMFRIMYYCGILGALAWMAIAIILCISRM